MLCRPRAPTRMLIGIACAAPPFPPIASGVKRASFCTSRDLSGLAMVQCLVVGVRGVHGIPKNVIIKMHPSNWWEAVFLHRGSRSWPMLCHPRYAVFGSAHRSTFVRFGSASEAAKSHVALLGMQPPTRAIPFGAAQCSGSSPRCVSCFQNAPQTAGWATSRLPQS